jgi:hypothetical protein
MILVRSRNFLLKSLGKSLKVYKAIQHAKSLKHLCLGDFFV